MPKVVVSCMLRDTAKNDVAVRSCDAMLALNEATCATYSLAINGDARGHKGHRASGQHDVLRGDFSTHVHSSRQVVLDSVRSRQLGSPNQDVLKAQPTRISHVQSPMGNTLTFSMVKVLTIVHSSSHTKHRRRKMLYHTKTFKRSFEVLLDASC